VTSLSSYVTKRRGCIIQVYSNDNITDTLFSFFVIFTTSVATTENNGTFLNLRIFVFVPLLLSYEIQRKISIKSETRNSDNIGMCNAETYDSTDLFL
jgi:hypothetical protein